MCNQINLSIKLSDRSFVVKVNLLICIKLNNLYPNSMNADSETHLG